MKIRFIYSILVFISFSIYAKYDVCLINQNYVKNVYFDNDLITKEIACKEGKRVESLLGLLKGFNIPQPELSIHLVPESDNASYDNGTLITIPLKFYSSSTFADSDKVYKSTRNLDAIILHEYGHAILASYLVTKWDGFSSYRKFGFEISKLKQELLLNEDAQKRSLLEKLEKELMMPRSMRNFTTKITPFQEFFSDVLSVTVLEDKDAIYNAIVAHDPKEYRYLYRSFDQVITSDESPIPDGHGYFFGARQLIGNKYWTQMLSDKNEFLQNVMVATTKELTFAFYMSGFMDDFLSDNEFFIETLSEHLR